MLCELTVQDLALVEKNTLRFAPGLNVITGETGAGKSVLMGALQLLLGTRADKKVLRSGAEQGSVKGVFNLADSAAVDRVLEDAGLEPCEEGLLIIRRVIKANGSGQQAVNDEQVTLAVLRKIGDLLVDMHGPYDHQSLLHPETQRRIVDTAGVPRDALDDYNAAWSELRDCEAALEDLQGDPDSFMEQCDLLRYRVKELEEAALEPGEEEELRAEHTLAGNAQNLIESLSIVLQALEEGEANVMDLLAAARRALNGIQSLHPDAEVWTGEVDQLLAQSRELGITLHQAGDKLEADPSRLEWLDQRLGLYSRLRKKYGPSVEDCLETLEESRSKLNDLENREQRLADLEKQIAAIRKTVLQHGKTLRSCREQTAKKLGEEILDQLVDLGFPHARFEISVTETEPDSRGCDEIDFQFAPNPGEDMRSLRDIASSGEISRVMLAIKTLLADHDRIPVMVFDEIDANVGGEMGHAIGKKMKRAGLTRQVISITHLPQVAVHGAQHLAVSKEVRDGRTYTRVEALSDADRENEIARMLGGVNESSLSLDHAREMLAGAKGQPKAAKPAKGFTLLEILFAMSILGIMGLMVFGSFQSLVDATTRAEKAFDKLHETETVLNQLTESLQAAAWFPEGEGRYELLHEPGRGTPPDDILSWVSASSNFLPSTHFTRHALNRIELSIQNLDGERGLALRTVSSLFSSDSEEFENANFIPVSTRVQGLSVRFYDVNRQEWTDEWERDNQLPVAVALTLHIQPEEESDRLVPVTRRIDIPVGVTSRATRRGQRRVSD